MTFNNNNDIYPFKYKMKLILESILSKICACFNFITIQLK